MRAVAGIKDRIVFQRDYGGLNGILGILNEQLIDLNQEMPATLKALKHTPAAALGTYVDVKSYVFEIKVDAVIDDYKRTFYGIVSRGGNKLQCVKFYWE